MSRWSLNVTQVTFMFTLPEVWTSLCPQCVTPVHKLSAWDRLTQHACWCRVWTGPVSCSASMDTEQPVPLSWSALGWPELLSGLDMKLSREADSSSNVNSSLSTALRHALHDGIDPAPVNYWVKVRSAGQQNKLERLGGKIGLAFVARVRSWERLHNTFSGRTPRIEKVFNYMFST